jgi:hypothetical protein
MSVLSTVSYSHILCARRGVYKCAGLGMSDAFTLLRGSEGEGEVLFTVHRENTLDFTVKIMLFSRITEIIHHFIFMYLVVYL